MSTELRCFSPVLEEFCRRLGPASWAVVAVSEIAALALWPLAGRAQSVTATVNTGSVPAAVAVNPGTNRIYVASGPITVIDGATNVATAVNGGGFPVAVAVNPVTNKIYVANRLSNNVTVIDGVTNGTTTVTAGNIPFAVAVNPVTN